MKPHVRLDHSIIVAREDETINALVELALGVAVIALAGCSALDRINSIGEAPKMSDIQNPTATTGYRPISMPMPPPPPAGLTSTG